MFSYILNYAIDNFTNIITTPLTLVVLYNIVEITVWSQAWIAEKIPSLNKYKIQKDKVRNNNDIIKCIKHVALYESLLFIPLALVGGDLSKIFGLTYTLPLPSFLTIFWMLLFCFLVDDAWQFWNHYLLHTPFLYRHVHKIHHEFKAPFALVSNYFHPIELFSNSVGSFIGPFLLLHYYGDMHILTFYLWFIMRFIMNAEIHLGYQFPWSLTSLIPGHGGIQYHDYHHKNFDGNYSPGLVFWDYLCGTRHPKYQPIDFK